MARHIPFALAGAFATATHTGRWRDTNDMDLYTLPQHRDDLKDLIEVWASKTSTLNFLSPRLDLPRDRRLDHC